MYEVDFSDVGELLNDWIKRIWNNRSRYIVCKGGGGSGKSYGIAQLLIYRAIAEQGHKILVIRKVANTLRESCFSLLIEIINAYGCNALFKINKSDMTIECINGNKFIFRGLDDVEKIKSINGITDIWIEETSELEVEDFRQLNIRLRGKTKYAKQFFITFNPVSISHWLKTEFFDNKKSDSILIETTYKDNRFLDIEAKKVLENFKHTDPYYYQVYCLNQWGILGKTVFDSERLSNRLIQIQQRKRRLGRFKLVEGKYTFVDDNNGSWCLLRDVEPNKFYCIGADVAEGVEHGDYSAAQILDNNTLEQVAVYQGHLDADLYSEELEMAGYYFNTALINVEINMESGVIRNLERKRYPKLYLRQEQDSMAHAIQKKYGWRTTETSRRLIVSNLIEYVRDHSHLINCIVTIDEMLTFIRNKNGRPEAQSGKKDDLVMAYAIALETCMSGQQQKGFIKNGIDFKKLEKMPSDVQEDFWNLPEDRRMIKAKEWGILT